ncbi:hypothetical protein CXF97_09330 [Pseudomonas sp. Choline-02u-1]|nr:hypothetical protein CXF97_09330 [Pseudomonas sp. Choline-02u-1]
MVFLITTSPVGVSLPLSHPTSSPPDTPSSRASPLPQFRSHSSRQHAVDFWEWACSRRRHRIQHPHWLTHRLREQARSQSFDRIRPDNMLSTSGSGLAHEGVIASNILTG